MKSTQKQTMKVTIGMAATVKVCTKPNRLIAAALPNHHPVTNHRVPLAGMVCSQVKHIQKHNRIILITTQIERRLAC
jgi:hypothetical protein